MTAEQHNRADHLKYKEEIIRNELCGIKGLAERLSGGYLPNCAITIKATQGNKGLFVYTSAEVNGVEWQFEANKRLREILGEEVERFCLVVSARLEKELEKTVKEYEEL